MEQIIKNPGYQHIAESIFLNLDYEKLQVCECINNSSQEILNNPMFWLKRWTLRGISQKNRDDWSKAIQIVPKFSEEISLNLTKYLKRIVRNERLVDIPCYIDQETIEEVLHWENQYREWDMETISYFGAGAVQVKSILSKKFNLEDVNQLIVKSAIARSALYNARNNILLSFYLIIII